MSRRFSDMFTDPGAWLVGAVVLAFFAYGRPIIGWLAQLAGGF